MMQLSVVHRTLLALVVCVAAWGSVFPSAKLVLADMDGLSLAMWRLIFSVAGLAAYCLWIKMPLPPLRWWQYAALAVAGMVGVGGFNVWLFIGLTETSAANAALIMALSPLVTTLFANLLAGTLPGRMSLLSLLISLGGVLLVISHGDLALLRHLQVNHGDLYVLAGMLAWSGYTLFAQRVSHWLPPLGFTLLTMMAGMALIVLVNVQLASRPLWQELIALPPLSLGLLLYISLFATVLGYLFWNNGIKQLGAARTSLFFNLVPLFAALSSLLLGQHISLLQWVGMLVVLGGLLLPKLVSGLGQWRQRRAGWSVSQ